MTGVFPPKFLPPRPREDLSRVPEAILNEFRRMNDDELRQEYLLWGRIISGSTFGRITLILADAFQRAVKTELERRGLDS